MRMRCLSVGVCAVMALWGQSESQAQGPNEIPEPLQPWVGWVTADLPEQRCPMPWNDVESRLCFWPGALTLSAYTNAGQFEFTVDLFSEGWIALPGGKEHWPLDVQANDVPVPVVERSEWAQVRLMPGRSTLRGGFRWDELPQRIAIPEAVGLVALQLNGNAVESPPRDAEGLLWLKRSRAEESEQEFLAVQVFRLIEDGIPMWLRTEIEISAAGRSREASLGHLLPERWKLSSIDSPIPCAVDDEGRMKVQVRAGKWRIQVDAFSAEPIATIRFAEGAQPMTTTELVGLRTKPELRVIEVNGIHAVDVSQTTFPDQWRSWPVFHWPTDQAFAIDEKMRGMGFERPPGLQVRRQLWLDEGGNGITFNDLVNGNAQRIWRLDAATNQMLGAVKVGGDGQLITRNPLTGAEGVELRSRDVDLWAVGRIAMDRALPASGWRTDADSVSTTLHLPPGWRVLAVWGPETVSGDWLTAWTLLDVFLLLVFSLGVLRMWGWTAAAVAFSAFVISYHEPGSPKFAWLALLVALGLERVVSDGWARTAVVALKWAAVVILAVVLVPFVARQVQIALYPQLEGRTAEEMERAAILQLSGIADPASLERLGVTSDLAPAPQFESKGSSRKDKLNLAYDTQARIQTGPAVPQWTWRSINYGWNSPVAESETVTLWLIPLPWQRVIIVMRIALLLALLALLLRLRIASLPSKGNAAAAALAILAFSAAPSSAQDLNLFPQAHLLEELRERVTKVPDAFPHAAAIPRVRLGIDGRRLDMQVEVHVAAAAAVPLPGRLAAWSPVSVQANGGPCPVLRRDGFLWVALPAGLHTVEVSGLLPATTEWEWSFLLKPQFVDVRAPGWTVTGIRPNGVPEAQVFFTFQEATADQEAAYDRKDFHAVASVSRQIELGLVWQVRTTVERLSTPGKAMALRLPLLPGERVLTGGAIVEEGTIQIRLGADETQASWESELNQKETVELRAASTDRWVERWELVTSPVWNVALSGLAPIFEAQQSELVPVWLPWPGETVTLAISRPEPVSGETVTVSRVEHRTTLGQRHRTARMDLTIQASLGSDFLIALHPDAEVTELSRAGERIPVRKEDATVIVPVRPGEQAVSVSWRRAEDLASRSTVEPATLPVESANVSTQLDVPEDRWIVWAWGPMRGPAVRFWAVLIAVIIGGWILGRWNFSPLRWWQWVLLLLGLSQVGVEAMVPVVGFILLLAWRGREATRLPSKWINAVQVLLILALFPLAILLLVVLHVGLLGTPEMQIAGNGSFRNYLVWFAPRAARELPDPGVVTVSIWWYRLLMLAWALWLANGLVRGVRWGWGQASAGGFWRGRQTQTAPPVLQTES